ncbi:MAG: methylaspartate mutase, partial [Gammaproteobacteria bacterium]
MSDGFVNYIQKAKSLGKLVVQPRMGFGQMHEMESGLKAVKQTKAMTIGTITLDSYTRVNQYQKAKNALINGDTLNGFPIVTHGAQATKNMLENLLYGDFSVQVRHGTALPKDIFQSIIDSGIDATEGGPVSYCLPYSRVPLESAIKNWRESCQLFAKTSNNNRLYHIESFAGCMLGQLCPPSLLIALGILECLFFKSNGIQSVSLS